MAGGKGSECGEQPVRMAETGGVVGGQEGAESYL